MPLATKYHPLSDEPFTESNNLWIGNLAPNVSDADVMIVFGKHGALDSIKKNASRTYSYVYFKSVEDAKAAKDALQGTLLHGNALKIDFAQSPKPCKNLWVGRIGPSITKEELEQQFRKFGRIQEFKFLRDRNTAVVIYLRLGDATKALKSLNGKPIGDADPIYIEYLRFHPKSKEQVPDRDPKEGKFPNRSMGVPNSLHMPNDVLRNHPEPAHYGLNMLQHSQSAIGGQIRDGQPSNVLCILYPPSFPMDEKILHNAMNFFGEIEGIKSFPLKNFSLVEFKSAEEAEHAKEGLQGKLLNDPRILIMYSSSHDHSVGPNSFPGHLLPCELHTLQNSYPNVMMGGPNLKRLSPLSIGPVSGICDVFDASQQQRQSKRSRTGVALSTPDPSLGKRGGRLDQFYGHGPQIGGCVLGGPVNVQGTNGFGSVDSRVVTVGTSKGLPELGYIWRGVIAKGGMHVCHARCVPVEKELGPDIVNCSARTGLDILKNHYDNAVGFNLIYFLPEGVEDFAPYADFLRYLGANNRAGVVQFADGTTLFLVPPSDFLSKVLNYSGPERLYGVVLKYSQHAPGSTSDRPQNEIIVMPQEERVLQTDNNRVPHESPNHLPKSIGPSTGTKGISTSGLTLTPQLITTLASLLPKKGNLSGAQSVSGSSNKAPEQGGQSLNNPHEQFPSRVGSNTPGDSAQGLAAKKAETQDSTLYIPRSCEDPSTQTNYGDPHVNNIGLVSQNQVVLGAGQGKSEVDVNKEEQYRATLQFAANLLKHVYQRQQSGDTEVAKGSGNH